MDTYVIYSNNIKRPTTEYKFGSIHYKATAICMATKDGDAIFEDIQKRLQQGEDLTEKDLMDLTFLPLMSSKLTKLEIIKKTLILTKEFETEKTKDVQSLVFVLGLKFLKPEEIESMVEVFKMTMLGKMLYDNGRAEGKAEGKAEGITIGEIIGEVKTLYLRLKLSIEEIAEELNISTQQVTEIVSQINA